MAAIVPQTNDRLDEIALIAEDGKRGRIKERAKARNDAISASG